MKKIISLLLIFLIFALCGCGKNQADLTLLTGKAVVLGDSLWAIDKTETGVGKQLASITSLEVLDYTVSGTCAARVEGYSTTNDCMVALLLDDTEKGDEIRAAISEADYVFIEHCNNDYAMGVPLTGPDYSYEEALTDSITVIKELNPSANIVMIAPPVGYFGNTDKLSTEQDFGYGTIDDYIAVMKSVASNNGASFINMQEAWTLTHDNWSKYTADGVHMLKETKVTYAEFLAQKLYEIYVGK